MQSVLNQDLIDSDNHVSGKKGHQMGKISKENKTLMIEA